MEFIIRLYDAAMKAETGAKKLRALLPVASMQSDFVEVLTRAVTMQARADTLNEIAEELASTPRIMLQLSGGSLYKRKPQEQMN